jgi:hypothetical protein
LHKTAANLTGSRPFQKKKSQSSRSLPNLQSSHHHRALRITTPPLTPQQLNQINKEAKELAELTLSIFTQLSDVWPFHWRQQIDNQGRTRYRLTQEEREQLKSLGLQRLFNTSWPRPDPPHSALGRWKKS